MKISRYLQVAVLAGAVLTTNCNKDDDTSSRYNADTDVVKINFTAGNKASRLTRSNPLGTTEAKQAAFNAGNEIAVKVTDPVTQEFVTYTLDDEGHWYSDVDEYLLWKTPTQTFEAVYPAEAKDGFTQPEDQSDDDLIAAADYMTVSKECTRPDGDSYITLALERQTARVIVKIAGFNNQYTAEEKVVQSLEISGVTSPYVQVEQDVDPGKVGTTYTALILPDEINHEEDGNFITLIDGQGEELYVKTAELPVDIEKGKSYTFSLTIGKDVIQVGDVTVNEWNESTLDGGKAVAEGEDPFLGGPKYAVYLYNENVGVVEVPVTDFTSFPVEFTYTIPNGVWSAAENLSDEDGSIVCEQYSDHFTITINGEINSLGIANQVGLSIACFPVLNVLTVDGLNLYYTPGQTFEEACEAYGIPNRCAFPDGYVYLYDFSNYSSQEYMLVYNNQPVSSDAVIDPSKEYMLAVAMP